MKSLSYLACPKGAGTALLLWGVLLAPSAARAAFLSIDDARPDETIGISANDFEGGLSINGSPFQIGLGSPASALFPENGVPITFSGIWVVPLPPGSIPPTTVIFYDPIGEPGQISDILEYSIFWGDGLGHINGSFISDSEQNDLGPLPPQGNLGLNDITDGPVIFFDERNGLYDFSAPFLTANAVSDSDSPVPEASTYAAGAFLAGLIGWTYLRRRQAVA